MKLLQRRKKRKLDKLQETKKTESEKDIPSKNLLQSDLPICNTCSESNCQCKINSSAQSLSVVEVANHRLTNENNDLKPEAQSTQESMNQKDCTSSSKSSSKRLPEPEILQKSPQIGCSVGAKNIPDHPDSGVKSPPSDTTDKSNTKSSNCLEMTEILTQFSEHKLSVTEFIKKLSSTCQDQTCEKQDSNDSSDNNITNSTIDSTSYSFNNHDDISKDKLITQEKQNDKVDVESNDNKSLPGSSLDISKDISSDLFNSDVPDNDEEEQALRLKLIKSMHKNKAAKIKAKTSVSPKQADIPHTESSTANDDADWVLIDEEPMKTKSDDVKTSPTKLNIVDRIIKESHNQNFMGECSKPRKSFSFESGRTDYAEQMLKRKQMFYQVEEEYLSKR